MIYNKGGNTRTAAPGTGAFTYNLPTATIEEIAFNRTNPEAGFMGKGNIYRTTNLSAATPTWTQISTFAAPIKAVHSCIADINRLYVITDDDKIYVSTNAMSGSPTFTPYNLPTSSNSIASIAAVANNANTVYISINDKVYVSTNGGAGWTDITYNLPAVNHRRILAEEYGGTQELVFIATNNAVYYKKAGQVTWTNYSTNLPARRGPSDFSMYDNGTNQALIRYTSYGRGMWETSFTNLRTPQAAFTSNITKPCPNGTVQFTDGTVGFTPTTWAWSFPGGTPAASAAQNPLVTYSSAGASYDVTLTASDGVNTSTVTLTNYISTLATIALPYSEGFEGAFLPAGLTLASNSSFNFEQSTSVGGFGTSSKSASFINWENAHGGTIATMTTNPIVLAPGSTSSTFLFDVAYSRYFFDDDTLTVSISTDCGTSYTELYRKNGTQLSTNGGGYNFGSSFVPTPSEWRTDNIDINAYSGQTAIFKIRHRILSGNNLYLDNLNINQTLNSSFVISASAGANGSISPGGAVSVNYGANQTFTIAADPCYRIANVWVDGVLQTAAPTFTFTNVTANHTIVATFAQLSYNISASAGPGGNISPSGTLINCGGSQTFNITANSCYQIANVIVDGVSQGAVPTYTFTNVTANHTISATFTPFTYTITATAGPGGNITQSGAIVVNCGTNKTFTINPNPGFAVQNVLVDAASQGAITAYTFYNVTTAHTISASFISSCISPVPAGAISGPPKVCKNQTGIVYTVGAIANATSYVWTLPAGMTPVSGGLTTTGNSITVKTNNTFTGGSITVKGSNTCSFGTISQPFVISLFTIAPTTPTAINNLTGTVYGYCAGNIYTFTTTATNATSFVWTISCGSILSGQGTNTVSAQVGNSCSGCKIEVKAVNCKGQSSKRGLDLESVLPKPSISGPSYVCKNTNPVATYTVTCADGATSFTWSSSNPNVKFSTGGTPTNPFTTTGTSVTVNFAGVANGTRNVRVTANNSCGSSEREIKYVTVANCNAPVTRSGQNPKQGSTGMDADNLKVYPNPTHDEMNISLYSKITARYSLKLINSQGQIVRSETKSAVTGSNNYRISMKGLASGIYQVILQSGETIMQAKIVKE